MVVIRFETVYERLCCLEETRRNNERVCNHRRNGSNTRHIARCVFRAPAVVAVFEIRDHAMRLASLGRKSCVPPVEWTHSLAEIESAECDREKCCPWLIHIAFLEQRLQSSGPDQSGALRHLCMTDRGR